MKREKRYTMDLRKRIRFVCRNCNVEMSFWKDRKNINISCPRCEQFFRISVFMHVDPVVLVYKTDGLSKKEVKVLRR